MPSRPIFIIFKMDGASKKGQEKCSRSSGGSTTKEGYYFCLSSSGVSLKTQFDNRNMIMGINTDHFDRYKDSYTEVLKAYDLFEGEDDLYKLV